MATRHEDGTMVGSLESMLATFEEDNPEIVAELAQLGMQIDDYARLLLEFEPPVITTNNTTGDL